MRLGEWLKQRYPTAKRQTLKRMVEMGRVTVNGVPARFLKQEIGEGVEVCVGERPAPAPAPALPLPIVYEDDDVIVIDKPVGLLTSTGPREKRATAVAMIRAYVTAGRSRGARVGVIHRLDRAASGLLVFSKDNAAYESLKGQFFHHTVRRVYLAAVSGVPMPPAGRIETHLVERADGTVYSSRQTGVGEHALTEYQVVRDDGRRALVRVTLHTGRKHQIRVHLSERGWPIVGDDVYGREAGSRLMLAAVLLEFAHPRDGRAMRFEIRPPGEIVKCLG